MAVKSECRAIACHRSQPLGISDVLEHTKKGPPNLAYCGKLDRAEALIWTSMSGPKVLILAEFERELIIERTNTRARGRNGGRPYKMVPQAQLRRGKTEERLTFLGMVTHDRALV